MSSALLLILLLPTLAAAQGTKPEAPGLGRITGQLIYPSDYFPDNMRVTAISVADKGRSYSTTRTQSKRYSLRLPAGDYYVYATTGDMPGYRAYYTNFVTCGLTYGCLSHTKIVVHVQAGTILARIDPEDWYEPARPTAADSVKQ